MGTFVFRWPHAANDVHVTGTFDDWGKTEKLEKVGDVFEKEVTLPSANEKYYYKFVVDELWTTDHEAPQEEDGHYNINNVLLPEQIKKTAGPSTTSGQPPGSNEHGATPPTVGPSSGFNESSAAKFGGIAAAGGVGAAMLASVTPQSTTAALAGSVPKEAEKKAEEDGDKSAATAPNALEPSTSPPGAFPETPANENEEFAVKPIPASEGIGNPISVPAGEKLPEPTAINSNTVDSTATTSKEGYEKDASAAFPAAAAVAGVGIAGAAGAGAYAHKKMSEPDSFSVNPIPASSGIGNPISVPAGEKLPEQSAISSNTVQSTVTTSKEAYEKDASALVPPSAAVADATGTGVGAATDSALSVPEKSKNMIPESSLPMGGEAKDTTDTGPIISSAAPISSTAQMASAVPLEPKREAMVIEDEAPSATLSGPAPTIPEMVKESLSEAHQSPEAAGSPEAVDEKALMENELLSKVKSTDAAGEPAPSPAPAGTSSVPVSSVASNVPAVVKESISEAHQPPEAAAAQEVVNEKRDVETELLSTVKSTDATGEPAPTAAAATAETAPTATSETAPTATAEKALTATTETAPTATGETVPTATGETAAGGAIAGATTLVSAGVLVAATATADAPAHAPPYEAATPGVETVHPAPHAATEAPPTTAATGEKGDSSAMSPDPSAPTTPAKATTTGNTPTKYALGSAAAETTTTPSVTGSPASTATKEAKSKKRRSFFGKLKDKLKEL